MFRKLADLSNAIVSRWLPDPFLFVALLTMVIFALGIAATPTTPLQMLEHWGGGFWNLLSFAMQMAMVLVTGHVLANTAPLKRVLSALAGSVKSASGAIVLVTVVALVASWINWGFGLVIGAIFAKELARRVPRVDYPLLIASAYSGFVIWHAGLSGSVPLTIATSGHFLEKTMGLIPTGQTIFAAYTLVPVAILLVLVPLVNRAMLNREHPVVIDPAILDEADRRAAEPVPVPHTPAERLENSVWVSWVIGLLGLAYTVKYFVDKGAALNLNIVNFIFLFAGILLHGTPRRFIDATVDAVKGSAGILIQFPFYAGLAGMMAGSGLIQFPFYAGLAGMMAGSGLIKMFSDGFIAIATPETLPLFAFLSAGLVNIFVPSGGGQWAVQGPIMVQAAQEIGASLPKTVMGVAWGDAWTNLIQPFWALPALGIAGLKARDIMGYCLIVLFVVGAVVGLSLWLIPG